MSSHDHLDEVRPTLPPEAGSDTDKGFEPNDDWLATADKELQVDAMREWFLSRYCDPAMETPYSEGEYIYIHGGPYDADDQLSNRFGGVFDDDVIQQAVDEVQSDGIYDWAPIHSDGDYDENFELGAVERDDPLKTFRNQLAEVDALAAAALAEPIKGKLRLLLFSSLITALEAYLADTMSYWVGAEKKVFRNLVANCEEFKKEKLALSEILDRVDNLNDDVSAYLKQLIWHRLDKVSPLMAASLGIKTPVYADLMRSIATRHDIVHRGGRTKDGAVVTVSDAELTTLRGLVDNYVADIEAALLARFPLEPQEF